MDRVELKRRAREQLGNGIFQQPWLLMVAACLIYSAITSVVSSYGSFSKNSIAISLGSIASLLLAGPLELGLTRMTINRARDNKEFNIEELFSGFKDFGNAFVLYLLRAVFVFLWTLLLIVPGIIKAYAYSMAFYIQNDNPDMGASDCLKESQEMMNGHKMELFIMDLSFIGWFIVGLLCLGVGTLWVEAYYQMARANFYLELKGQTDESGDIVDADVVTEDEIIDSDVFADKN